MNVLEALITSVGVVCSVMAIAVLWRPNGWRVLKQSIEIVLGVISGDLIYSEQERDSERAWTPEELAHLKRGIELLAAMFEDVDDDDDDDVSDA